MLNYEECKKIAVDITEKNGIPIDKAGELLDAYVFDSTNKSFVANLPIAVDRNNGKVTSLWLYLQNKDPNITFDDVVEREF